MSQDPVRKWEILRNIVGEIIEEMCPTKTFRINQIKQPWIFPLLLNLLRIKMLHLKEQRIVKIMNYGITRKASKFLYGQIKASSVANSQYGWPHP